MTHRRPTDAAQMLNLAAAAMDTSESTERVTDPLYASYAQGVAETLSWLAGNPPSPALHDLLDLENGEQDD